MADLCRVVHEIPPVYDARSRVLILGTIPSPKSREYGFFYGHPQNRFWKVLAALFQSPVPQTNEQKRGFLLDGRIALWDVLAACEIEGASDASIKNATPNDLSPILASQPSVTLNTADYAAESREQADKTINGAGFTDCKRYVFSIPVSSQAWHREIQKIFDEKFSEPADSDDISIDGCILGKADWWMFAWLGATEVGRIEYLRYKGALICFKDGIWDSTYVTRYDSMPFNLFFSQIFPYRGNIRKTYNSIYSHPGVYLKKAPEIDSSNWFSAELSLSRQRRYSYSIIFSFLLQTGIKSIWSIREERSDALYSIRIDTNI